MAAERLDRHDPAHLQIAFVGFGEAASAFARGWAGVAGRPRAFDIKTDHATSRVREAKWADYEAAGVGGCARLAEALQGADLAFCLVTADQAVVAATDAAAHIAAGTLYLDCNSCSPDAKLRAARLVGGAGARYVDVAVMAPVHPRLHKTPLLVSGPDGEAACAALARLGMSAEAAGGEVGTASAIKMIRSVAMKGLEAVVLECVLAGRKAGVDAEVLASLEATYPGFDFVGRAGYMLERVMTHGVRRAAEMEEAARTVRQLGLDAEICEATVKWQRLVGEMGLAAESGDYGALADAILARLEAPVEKMRV